MLIAATQRLINPSVIISVSEKKVKLGKKHSTTIEIDFSKLSEKDVEILLNSIFTLEKVISKLLITTSSSSFLDNPFMIKNEDEIIFSDSNEILKVNNTIELTKKGDKKAIEFIKNIDLS